MAGERMYPILPCPDLDDAIAFYEALGFVTTYRQDRPNPYAVIARDDLQVHLAGIPGYDPATSVCSVIVTVPDAEEVRADFAAGLRGARGSVPVEGVPRLLRLRRKAGTATGFSVVDTGGNWLRFYRQDAAGARRGGRARRGPGGARRSRRVRGRDGRGAARGAAFLTRVCVTACCAVDRRAARKAKEPAPSMGTRAGSPVKCWWAILGLNL